MQRISRRDAIDTLRSRLLRATDGQHSLCLQAGRKGIYCGGLAAFTFDELKRRYDWIARERPDITRSELERLANLWHLGRQDVLGTRLCCDTQAMEHDTCRGWDEHSNKDLANWVREYTGDEVEIALARGGGLSPD